MNSQSVIDNSSLLSNAFPSDVRKCILAVLPIFLYFVAKSLSSKKPERKLPLPPGPSPKPVIGNMLDIPTGETPWLVWEKHSKALRSNVIHFEALGQHIVVVNKLDKANELMEKRSAIYSDRPSMPMLNMIDYQFSFGLMPYGNDWRRHRKVFHQNLHSHMVPRYNPIQEQEAVTFARHLLNSPENFFRLTRGVFSASIMRATYGFDKIDYEDRMIHDAETLLAAFSEVIVPGRYLVNHIPILKHIPSWFPGAAFQRKVQEMTRLSEKVCCDPFELSKRRGRENGLPSMATDCLEKLPEDDAARREEETVIKKSMANAFVAGADTTVGSAHALYLALSMHPEVQRKAQAELDAVVGPDRFPLLKDRDQLPYVQAVVKEVTRWHTALPMGVPRRCMEDDEFEGYHIPQGSIIMINQWAINHDPELYEDPMTFNPDRFMKDGKLDPSVPDPADVAFGFGRRICPGRHFSTDSVFIFAATLMALFNVGRAKDDDGRLIVNERLDVTSDVVSAPLPFTCEITPRSPAAVSLINRS